MKFSDVCFSLSLIEQSFIEFLAYRDAVGPISTFPMHNFHRDCSINIERANVHS